MKLFCVVALRLHAIVSFLLHYLFCIESDISGSINYFSLSELFFYFSCHDKKDAMFFLYKMSHLEIVNLKAVIVQSYAQCCT